jgi:hypothetical protein
MKNINPLYILNEGLFGVIKDGIKKTAKDAAKKWSKNAKYNAEYIGRVGNRMVKKAVKNAPYAAGKATRAIINGTKVVGKTADKGFQNIAYNVGKVAGKIKNKLSK